MSAIQLLSSHGLAHGDIKPENVLYTTSPGFDFEKPDVSKIHFRLTDFDTLAHIGELQAIHTATYAAPEVLLDQIYQATVPRDLYAHAASVHILVFGDRPFEKHFKSLRGSAATPAQFEEERTRIFDHPGLYEDYLKSIDERFDDLNSRAKSEASRKKIQELRDFVLNGLKFSSRERFAAFPEIREGMQRHFNAQRACTQSLIRNVSNLHY